jgi:hypothetical protein
VANGGAFRTPPSRRHFAAEISTSAPSREVLVSTGKNVWAIFVLVVLIGAFFDLGVPIGAADTISSAANTAGSTLANRTSYWRECRYFTFRSGPSTRQIPAERNGPLPACPMLPP